MIVVLKISIEEIGRDKEAEIIIRCHEVNDEVLQLVSKLKAKEEMVVAYDGNKIHQILPKDIYYFEAVDNKVFIYCRAQVFESKLKLYEIEQMYAGGYLLRISKSVIMNIKKIRYVSPAYNGRFEACLDNGEKQIISRQYVSSLKKKLMI